MKIPITKNQAGLIQSRKAAADPLRQRVAELDSALADVVLCIARDAEANLTGQVQFDVVNEGGEYFLVLPGASPTSPTSPTVQKVD